MSDKKSENDKPTAPPPPLTPGGTPVAGMGHVFGGASVGREAIPSADEGDALLDMLFDDAPRPSASPTRGGALKEEEQPTKVHSASELRALLGQTPGGEDLLDQIGQEEDLPQATSSFEAPGEVVAPPGWKISPTPPPMQRSVPRPAASAPGRPPPPRPSGARPPVPPAGPAYRAAPPVDFDDEDEDDGRGGLFGVGGEPHVRRADMPTAPGVELSPQAASFRESEPMLLDEDSDISLVPSEAPPVVLPDDDAMPTSIRTVPRPGSFEAQIFGDAAPASAPPAFGSVDDNVPLDLPEQPPEERFVDPPSFADQPTFPGPRDSGSDLQATYSGPREDSDPAFDDAPTAMGGALPVAPIDFEAEAPAAAQARPPSMRPPSMRPPVSVRSTFGEETDASVVLSQRGDRDAFVERARWIREEARLAGDRAKQARLLLVASELFASAGDDDDAFAAATEAYRVAPTSPLVARQYRALLARAGNWPGALEVMDAEVRAMPTPAARTHVAWMSSEIARIIGQDAEGAKRRADLAMRALPTDPRVHVQRFVETLAERPVDLAQLAKIKPIEMVAEAEEGASEGAPAARPLAEGFARVLAGRGHPHRADAALLRASPSLALLHARNAAADQQPVEVFEAMRAIVEEAAREDAPLATAAAFGAGFLAASRPETRSSAAEMLSIATQGTHRADAERALGSAALESGGGTGMSLESDAFTPIDRWSLYALSGGDRPPPLDGDAKAYAPLVHHALALRLPSGEGRFRTLDETSGLVESLARGFVSIPREGQLGSTFLVELVDRARKEAAEGSASPPVFRAISFALDVESGAASRMASRVADFADGADADEARVAWVAHGLLAELARDTDAAKIGYDRAVAAEPSEEALVRARAGFESPLAAARMMRGFADGFDAAADEDAAFRKGLLLAETAMRFEAAGAGEESLACLKSAVEADPKSPLALYLGERAARAAGDQDMLLEWLRLRREASDDPIERAYDLTREALLVSDGESPTSSLLLEEALGARPVDVGLRDLYERLSTDPPADRAAWREARAENGAGPDAARLALEAAIDYELAGNIEAAARAVKLAEAAGEKELAPIFAYRYALLGHGTAELVDALLGDARKTEDPDTRRELYERLADLDERGRGDASSGLLFRRMILEENPGHVRTLRAVASTLMAQNREVELEPIAFDLAKALEGPEAAAYALLSARLRHRTSWEETAPAIEIAFRHEATPGVLRQMGAHARAKGDLITAAQCDLGLRSMTERPSEVATLSTRAAESLERAGKVEEAISAYRVAVEAYPAHVTARLSLARLLESNGDHHKAAVELEALAGTLEGARLRGEVSYRAAVLWQDHENDADRARPLLEAMCAVDVNHADAFERLRRIYVQGGARAELAELLERKLASTQDPAERVDMEVMRGKALAEVGDSGAAKRALLAALEQSPDHYEALAAFADLCAEEGDYENAEQALIRLARLATEADKQIHVYFRLGDLYDDKLPNPDRAEAAYREILKRDPQNLDARAKIVALLRNASDYVRAVEEQSALCEAASTPELKCDRTIELAEIFEQMGELKKAETTLVTARKSYPKSDAALRGLVRFYQRTGQHAAAAILLDRAVTDARRALSTGRFEPYLFETLWTVAEVRGRGDAARVARATVLALDGAETDINGGGIRAGDAKLDDLLAPDVMSPAFRELLLRTGPMLDQAVPFNYESIRAVPLPPQATALGEEIRALAVSYGFHQINILVSSVLGSVCAPATAHPPTLVIGQALAGAPPSPVRTFLFHRAMKVLQSNAAAFARTAPIDLWPLLAAYLKVFSQSWTPQGVDAGKLTEAYGRLSRTVPGGMRQDVMTLATEVIGAIGNRASTLNTAVNGWGSRAGLLAVGDPNVAFSAIALATGSVQGPPPAGKERVTWVGRNAETRDLIVFSVSDAYVEARARLGLD